MSRSRISKTCSSLALIQSIRDLVAVLATLPMDLRFTNTWLNPLTHASLGRPSFQIVVLFQNVHEYIMVSLVRFSQRGGTTDTGQYPIRLPEPLQTQMIVSCLEIMAILDYFMLQRQEEALLNTHIFHQTSIAADILGWPDLLPHIPPYRIYIVRIITHLRHLFHQQPQLSPEATLNALAQLLSMVDQHTVEHSIQGPRVSADSVTYAPRQSIEPVIDCWHVDPSMELVRHGPLNRQADLQARSSLDKNYLENEVLVGFDCGGVLVPSNQPSWGLIGDTRFDHKHEDSFQVVCDGDKFRTRSSTSASQGQNSRALSDANLTATHALLCYSSSSTVSMSSMLDPSYPASAYTPSSSQYSHPVTPVADQNMVNEHEAGPQLLDRMEREGGDGQQFWTCSYV